MTASEFKLLSYILDYHSNYNDRVQRGLKPKYKEILSSVRAGKVPGLTFADAERIEKVLPRECRIYPNDEITPLSQQIISNKLSDEFKSRLHRLHQPGRPGQAQGCVRRQGFGHRGKQLADQRRRRCAHPGQRSGRQAL